MKPKRIVLYARVSTKDKGLDTKNQLAQLRDFCGKQDWTIAREYVDHASAKTGDRPQFKAMMEAAAVLQGQLIAAQSELQGLRQIYTDNNVRVRSIRARIGELQRQLEKIGGKGEDTSDPNLANDALYPSIRKLPLLGVTWADLYRQTKVQEAVFETLTKQYELAKVQEAKEIPTVKVLDAPVVPEKKVFPPRMLIILLGTALSSIAGVICVFASRTWNDLSADDPRKTLLEDAVISIEGRIVPPGQEEADGGGWRKKLAHWIEKRRNSGGP